MVMVASGGVYSNGPAQGMDFVEPYLRSVFGFIGPTNATFIWAEAQADPEAGPETRKRGRTHPHGRLLEAPFR